MHNKSMQFFDAQFRRQVSDGEFKLNSFELRALKHLAGDVLDLGCGLGNLSLEAARRGCRVVAVDSSPTAIARIKEAARIEGLGIDARIEDMSSWNVDRSYDTIVAIGLLMFFPRSRGLALLRSIQSNVAPGGTAVINVLVEGTTYLDMFQPGAYYLFGRSELAELFAGWAVRDVAIDSFFAPGGTLKQFCTVTAVKPR